MNQWNHATDQGYVGIVRSAPLVTSDEDDRRRRAGRMLCTASPPAARWPGRRRCRARFSALRCRSPRSHLPGPSARPRGQRAAGPAGLRRRQQPQGPLGVSHRRAGGIDARDRRRRPDLFRRQRRRDSRGEFLGKAQWTADVGSPVRSAGTILAPSALAFGLDNETLVVLDCSSGRVWPPRAGPRSAARWGRTGRNSARGCCLTPIITVAIIVVGSNDCLPGG